ncbi:hypothetical protein ACHAXA_003684 [Cyclostephanos tholiformis]|uniref:Uncharacterized protein n=1 Tax=Cyclostephanos tholiformis TaxID=382380 RepID=A0ABD3SPR3_9STRA
MEGRVAGTQFSMAFPPPPTSRDGVSTDDLRGSAGFILSGDGDDHDYMPQGEFHAYFPRPAGTVTHEDDDSDASSYPRWRALPPHPGASRWAPGSFVMRGSARAYFLCGYDRYTNEHRSDVWGIDLSSLFSPRSDGGAATPSTTMTTTSSIAPSIATMTSAFAAPAASPWTVASNNADLDTTDDDVEVFDVACATRDECDARRSDMNMTAFRVGNYPSKGCFAKNGIAYWSYGGDAEEMSFGDLPGEQERIWCAGGGNGGGGRHSPPTPAAASSTSAILIPSSLSVKIRTATLVVGTSVIAICWLVQ